MGVFFEDEGRVPGHASHEKGLQRQNSVDQLVSARRVLWCVLACSIIHTCIMIYVYDMYIYIYIMCVYIYIYIYIYIYMGFLFCRR